MFIDNHPYLSIYLLGSILVVALTFIKISLFYIVDWITKGNILTKNLKKIDKPDEKSWYLKILLFLGTVLFEAALSWVNVLVILVQIPWTLIKVLRDLITSAPEEVKVLRFPLRNNPMLSKEAVWAYIMALNVRMGVAMQDENQIIAAIEEVLEKRPDFNYQDALDKLDELQVIIPEIITSVKGSFVPKDDRDSDYNIFAYAPAEDEDDWHSEMRLIPSAKRYMIYSRTPDYLGQYKTRYEYKIEGDEIYIRVIESRSEYISDIDYDIKDNVVLENEVRERMSESAICSDPEEIDRKINELNEDIKWQEINKRFKYFIMLRHRHSFSGLDFKKYYRSELERIKNGYSYLDKEVKKNGGYIVKEDMDNDFSYIRIGWDDDLPEDEVEKLSELYNNLDQFNISHYEIENIDKIIDELTSYLDKLN